MLWSRRNLHCYRNKDSISLEIRVFNESVGRRIVDHSRLPVAQYLDDFDVFVFTEDDMILTYSLLTAWVHETKLLATLTDGKTLVDKDRCGWRYPCRYSVGLLRYSRKTKYKMQTAASHEFRTNQRSWDESLVIDKNRLEEEPPFDPICIENQPYISLHTSSHQASWILTRNDIKELNVSCNFLGQYYHPHWKNSGMVREYMSSLSIYRNTWFVTPPLNCMVSKVIPLDKVEILKIRHYYRSKDSKQSSKPIFEADELTRAGIDYTSLSPRANPSCWINVDSLQNFSLVTS